MAYIEYITSMHNSITVQLMGLDMGWEDGDRSVTWYVKTDPMEAASFSRITTLTKNDQQDLLEDYQDDNGNWFEKSEPIVLNNLEMTTPLEPETSYYIQCSIHDNNNNVLANLYYGEHIGNGEYIPIETSREPARIDCQDEDKGLDYLIVRMVNLDTSWEWVNGRRTVYWYTIEKPEEEIEPWKITDGWESRSYSYINPQVEISDDHTIEGLENNTTYYIKAVVSADITGEEWIFYGEATTKSNDSNITITSFTAEVYGSYSYKRAEIAWEGNNLSGCTCYIKAYDSKNNTQVINRSYQLDKNSKSDIITFPKTEVRYTIILTVYDPNHIYVLDKSTTIIFSKYPDEEPGVDDTENAYVSIDVKGTSCTLSIEGIGGTWDGEIHRYVYYKVWYPSDKLWGWADYDKKYNTTIDLPRGITSGGEYLLTGLLKNAEYAYTAEIIYEYSNLQENEEMYRELEEGTFTTASSDKPNPFEWTQSYDLSTGGTGKIQANAYIPIDANGIHPVTAIEWNRFVDAVNEMRTYATSINKQVNGDDLQYVEPGDLFYDAYNLAVTAIKNIQDVGGDLPYLTSSTQLNSHILIYIASELNAVLNL